LHLGLDVKMIFVSVGFTSRSKLNDIVVVLACSALLCISCINLDHSCSLNNYVNQITNACLISARDTVTMIWPTQYSYCCNRPRPVVVGLCSKLSNTVLANSVLLCDDVSCTIADQ